ncbi:MAG: SGNH/GDSL hydrolase family protein [Flavobacteriaceae bacterium]|nr:SGNH/GDSL hydrolase family protein [Flavobacteriaceae bacterium]
MKKTEYIFIGIASAVLMAVGIAVVNKVSGAVPKAKKGGSILFVGDSLTEGNYSYSYLIKKLLAGRHVDILAKGGMRTKWMLDNLKTTLANKHYDNVVIYGGVNDMFSAVTPLAAIANIQAMVDIVVAQGGIAYVIVGYNAVQFMGKVKPTSYVPTYDGMWQLVLKYADFQRQLASKIKNATIIPVFSMEPSYTSDGIHPNGAGHVKIKDIVIGYLV